MIRTRPDQRPLPWTRPEPAEIDVGIAINCATRVLIDFPAGVYNNAEANRTIIKEQTQGPITIPDGLTFTVICTWIII